MEDTRITINGEDYTIIKVTAERDYKPIFTEAFLSTEKPLGVISPSWLSEENSCKIRHYEQCNYVNYVDKHSHAVLLCLLRIFACTEKKPHPVAMVLKLLAKWSYRTYSACLFTNFRV